jgi:hypothetical protein
MPTDETDWLAVCHDTQELLTEVSYLLRTIAKKLAYISPNSDPVNDLRYIADKCAQQEILLEKAVGEKLGEDLRAAHESSGNMLRACLEICQKRTELICLKWLKE